MCLLGLSFLIRSADQLLFSSGTFSGSLLRSSRRHCMALGSFHLLSSRFLFRGSKGAARLEDTQGNEPPIGTYPLMLLEI